MKVLKFGGTSVGTIGSLSNVKKIVDTLDEPGIVVVSALGGLTDGLIATARMAASGDEGFRRNMHMMAERHFDIINSLVPREKRSDVRQQVAEFLSQLEDIYIGVSLIGCLPDKVLNRIVSFGERMSSIMVANILRDACHADPLDFMKTNKEYGRDVIAANRTTELIRSRFPLPLDRTMVTGGFISRDLYTGEITNLGRGGSDFTAALIAAALGADVLEIWTDVDGFMTADPRVVPDACVIDRMSYPESFVLCEHGAKVIYTPTIRPVMEAGIAMKVLNTHNPSAPGTLIGPGKGDCKGGVCGISCMSDVALVTLHSSSCTPEDADAVSRLLCRHGIDSVCSGISMSDGSRYICIHQNDAGMAENVVKDKLHYASQDCSCCPVFRNGLAMLTLVGHSMKLTGTVWNDAVRRLADDNIMVVAVGYVEGDYADYAEFFVPEQDAPSAMRILHRHCFG